MSKEAYYFSHDSNAKDDPKCVQLIDDLGLEGYGIYWVLVEVLRDQPTYRYPLKLLPSIARKYNSTVPKVDIVVKNYGLFEIENDEFFSLSLNKRMEQKEIKSLKAKESANARWLKAQSDGNANALLTQSDGNAINEKKGKEKKEKEIKLNKEFQEKVLLLFSSRPLIVEAVNMWKTYKDGRKESYTTTMWLVSLNKQLEKFTESEIIDSMHVAISSNHQGYFPKKSTSVNTTTSKPYTATFQSYEDLKG